MNPAEEFFVYLTVTTPGKPPSLETNRRIAGRALFGSWFLFSAAGLAAVLAPLVIPPEALLRAADLVSGAGHGPAPCVLCGMSRAFCAIAEGSYAQALDLNPWSLLLFGMLTANGAVAGLVSLRAAGVRLRTHPTTHPTNHGGPRCRCSV
ncbi:MAG: DUF2752 domain-containing protein [Bacteroidota bacterium]